MVRMLRELLKEDSIPESNSNGVSDVILPKRMSKKQHKFLTVSLK